MALLSKACTCLGMALLLAAGTQAWAQSAPQSVPPVSETQAAPVAAPQAEKEQPRSGRQGRTKRAPRTSKRQKRVAGSQSIEQVRPSRNAGPMKQELTFTANALGGYDDNLTAGFGSSAGVRPTATASGVTESLDTAIRYKRGNALRSIGAESTGDLRAYPGYLKRPAAGGSATVDGRTALGRSLTLRASERIGYEPLFSVFSAGRMSEPVPPGIGNTTPASQLFEHRSLSSNSSVSIDRMWSGRDSTSLSYSYRDQRFTNGEFGDNTSHDVRAEYRRRLAPGIGTHADYQFDKRDYTERDGAQRPWREHKVQAGPEVEKDPFGRHLTVSFLAGGSYVESVSSRTLEPYRAWIPTGTANAKLALSPTWFLESGYRRDFSLLPGVTNETYTSDTAFLSTTWLVIPRTDLQFGGTYSNWRTPRASGIDEAFKVYGASMQVSVALTGALAASASYFYYHHRYSNPAGLPPGFPAAFDRNSVRIGLAVRFPLAGNSVPPRQGPM